MSRPGPPAALAGPSSAPAHHLPAGLAAPSSASLAPGDYRGLAGAHVHQQPGLPMGRPPQLEAGPQIYTMRELNQHTARVMSGIEQSGIPAFITKHGRFIAMITPLAAGEIESRVLATMAREIGAAADG